VVAGAGKGIGIAGASLAAGYVIDSLAGIDTKVHGPARLAVDGIVVPAILLSSMPMQYKLGAAGIAFGAARVFDYFKPAQVPHNDLADPVITSTWQNPPNNLLGRLSDNFLVETRRGQAKVDMSSVMAPNMMDAVGLPAAVMLLPSRYKLAGAAAVYVAGRVLNALDSNNKNGDSLVLPKR
jgi:hypothetical protein